LNALAEQVGGFGEPHNRHEKAEDDQPASGEVNVQGDAVEARGLDFLPAGLSARRAAEVHGQNGEQQLWMEETRSLGLKMDLIKKYDLAGVAGWRLGLETSDVWDVIGWE